MVVKPEEVVEEEDLIMALLAALSINLDWDVVVPLAPRHFVLEEDQNPIYVSVPS